MSPDFFYGTLFGMGLGVVLYILFQHILIQSTKNSYPKERDPADWWKDT